MFQNLNDTGKPEKKKKKERSNFSAEGDGCKDELGESHTKTEWFKHHTKTETIKGPGTG